MTVVAVGSEGGVFGKLVGRQHLLELVVVFGAVGLHLLAGGAGAGVGAQGLHFLGAGGHYLRYFSRLVSAQAQLFAEVLGLVRRHFLGRAAGVLPLLGWGSLGSGAEGNGNDCEQGQQKLFHEKRLKRSGRMESESGHFINW